MEERRTVALSWVMEKGQSEEVTDSHHKSRC